MESFLESEIRRLANDWYYKLDRYAPVDDVLPYSPRKASRSESLRARFEA
jgi:hypothetical protein